MEEVKRKASKEDDWIKARLNVKREQDLVDATKDKEKWKD